MDTPLKVVPVNPHAHANQEVINKLEDLLIKAKAGEIIGLVVQADLLNGCSLTDFTTSPDANRRLGAVNYLAHRLCLAMDRK